MFYVVHRIYFVSNKTYFFHTHFLNVEISIILTSMVTLTFEIRSWNIDEIDRGFEIYHSPKY